MPGTPGAWVTDRLAAVPRGPAAVPSSSRARLPLLPPPPPPPPSSAEAAADGGGAAAATRARPPRWRPWQTMRQRRRLRVQRGIGLRHPAEPGRPGEPWAMGAGYAAGNCRLCVKYATGHGHTVTARCGLRQVRLRREKLLGHCVGPGPWANGSAWQF
jgi:hypothetical protein